MKPAKVLYPTDFSDSSRSALRYAITQAQALNAGLLLVHVQEMPTVVDEGMLHMGIDLEDRAVVEQRLHSLVPNEFAGPCEFRVLTGNPAREIVRLAEQEAVDLIVLGTHGRTGLARVLMGSVAEQVVRNAKSPVLVVKTLMQSEAAPDENS
jgi:universal stress protein A